MASGEIQVTSSRACGRCSHRGRGCGNGGKVIATVDGGHTWTPQASGAKSPLAFDHFAAATPAASVSAAPTGSSGSHPPPGSAEAQLGDTIDGVPYYDIGSDNILTCVKWPPDGNSGTAIWQGSDCNPDCADGTVHYDKVKLAFIDGGKTSVVSSPAGKTLGAYPT